MYEPLLLVHSWVRWFVFLGIIYFLVSCTCALISKRSWTSSDSHFVWAFNQVFIYQVLFGFTLWLTSSPYVKAAFNNPKDLLSTPLVAFWSLYHPLTMITALGVFHMGKARAKRQSPDSRFKTYALTFALVLALVVCAIPWPFLNHGRPFVRSF